MRKFFTAVAIFWMISLLVPKLALAAASVNVSAAVPEQRIIYINSSGDIARVIGNTASNVIPVVVNLQNQVMPTTAKIEQQYQRILSAYGELQAGQTYSLSQWSDQTKTIPTNTNFAASWLELLALI